MGHAWPGNVRELRNLMERLVIMTDAAETNAADLAPFLAEEIPSRAAEAGSGPLAEQLAAFEQQVISGALENHGGNVAAAARDLGLDRANLHRKLKRLGLI